MKKNILIIILLLISICSVIYAFIKADEASKQAIVANISQSEALAERERADVQAILAIDRAADAAAAQAEAERVMELYMKCKEAR